MKRLLYTPADRQERVAVARLTWPQTGGFPSRGNRGARNRGRGRAAAHTEFTSWGVRPSPLSTGAPMTHTGPRRKASASSRWTVAVCHTWVSCGCDSLWSQARSQGEDSPNEMTHTASHCPKNSLQGWERLGQAIFRLCNTKTSLRAFRCLTRTDGRQPEAAEPGLKGIAFLSIHERL